MFDEVGIIMFDTGVHIRYTYCMTTKTVGIKEFRADIARFAKKARKGNVRYIVMNRNSPLFEIKPFAENEGLENVFADITAAEKEIKAGRVYSQEQIEKMLGL